MCKNLKESKNISRRNSRCVGRVLYTSVNLNITTFLMAEYQVAIPESVANTPFFLSRRAIVVVVN